MCRKNKAIIFGILTKELVMGEESGIYKLVESQDGYDIIRISDDKFICFCNDFYVAAETFKALVAAEYLRKIRLLGF